MGRGSGGAGRSIAKRSAPQKNDFTQFTQSDFAKIDAWGEKHYASFIDSLSDDERDAIFEYSGKSFSGINQFLRGQKDKISKKDQKTIDNLNKALESSRVPENIVAYRGATPFGQFKDLSKVKPGSTFSDSGFGSTSLNPDGAFSGGKNVTFHVRIPKGAKGAYIASAADNPDEQEFLLPTKTKYKVVSVNQKTKTVIVEVVI